jgi:hypothetical protein
MVMTLFGRRKQPPPEFLPENYPASRPFPTTPALDVFLQSFVISTVTALCEGTKRRPIRQLLLAQQPQQRSCPLTVH